jgi:hypothetical protein
MQIAEAGARLGDDGDRLEQTLHTEVDRGGGCGRQCPCRRTGEQQSEHGGQQYHQGLAVASCGRRRARAPPAARAGGAPPAAYPACRVQSDRAAAAGLARSLVASSSLHGLTTL